MRQRYLRRESVILYHSLNPLVGTGRNMPALDFVYF